MGGGSNTKDLFEKELPYSSSKVTQTARYSCAVTSSCLQLFTISCQATGCHRAAFPTPGAAAG